MDTKKILIVFGLIGSILILLLLILLFLNQQGPQQGPTDQNRVPTTVVSPQAGTGTENIVDGPVPRDENAYKETVAEYRTRRPDFFLKVYVPYQNNVFSVTSVMKETEGKAYFEFIVTSKTGSVVTAREGFIQWAESLGLTTDQINALKVSYE